MRLILSNDVQAEVSTAQAIQLVKVIAAAARDAKANDVLAVSLPNAPRCSLTCWQAVMFGKAVADAVLAELAEESKAEETRRAAGYSPISEEVAFVMNNKGEPVGARKRFRY
jgi:hypothetical protein